MAKKTITVKIRSKNRAPAKNVAAIHKTIFTIRALRVLSIIAEEPSHASSILDQYGFQHHNIMSLQSVSHVLRMLQSKRFIQKTSQNWKYNEMYERVNDERIVVYSITKQGRQFLKEIGNAVL